MTNELHVVARETAATQAQGEASKSPKGPPAKGSEKKKSGTVADPGEYLVIGELLRRGYGAQLADRNVKDYQLLAAPAGVAPKRVQVRTVRMQPWPVNRGTFETTPDQITVYVLLGPIENARPARFFIARNRDVADQAEFPDGWSDIGSMKLKSIESMENQWDKFRE